MKKSGCKSDHRIASNQPGLGEGSKANAQPSAKAGYTGGSNHHVAANQIGGRGGNAMPKDKAGHEQGSNHFTASNRPPGS